MADKKMTQLESLGTSIQSTDLLHVVTDPTNNAVNKKGTVAEIFGNLNHTTGVGDTGGKTFVKSSYTVGASGSLTYTGNLVNFTTSTISSPTTATTIPALYGQKTHMTLTGQNATYSGPVIGHEIVMDFSDTISDSQFQVSSKQYGIKILVDDSDDNRTTGPTAFICLNDKADGTLLTSENPDPGVVTNLLALGDEADQRVKITANSALFEEGSALAGTGMSSATLFGSTDSEMSKIKIQMNGTDFFLLATANGHYSA